MPHDGQASVPWTSWLLFVLFVGAGFVLFYFLHDSEVPISVRWIVTGLWMLVTLLLGSADLEGDPIGFRKFLGWLFDGNIDSGWIDRWTISHTGAGLVFGIWWLPLAFVLPLVIAWEVFEITVPGFGENESYWNRLTDILVAIIGWLLVVLLAHAISHTPIPWLRA
jgi:hypothetical protein